MQLKERLYQVLAKFGIRIFSKIFPEYFAKESLAPTDRYIENPFVIKHLPRPPAKILDVGCSGSFFPLLLSSFGYETYGIDMRNYPILNKLNFDNFTFIKGDIRQTSFSNAFFDVITAISIVEHIGISGRYGMDENLEGDKKALEEMKRILKPNGIILMTVPFGKAKILKPYCKIYDDMLIKELVKDFKIEEEEYYMQDSKGDWYRSPKNDAGAVEARSDGFSLCLLRIAKK